MHTSDKLCGSSTSTCTSVHQNAGRSSPATGVLQVGPEATSSERDY